MQFPERQQLGHGYCDGKKLSTRELTRTQYNHGDAAALGRFCKEDNNIKVLKILEKPKEIDWDYDEEADVLYISVGKPQPAVGIDIGQEIVVRYDEAQKEVVGITLIGLRDRVLKGISDRTTGDL